MQIFGFLMCSFRHRHRTSNRTTTTSAHQLTYSMWPYVSCWFILVQQAKTYTHTQTRAYSAHRACPCGCYYLLLNHTRNGFAETCRLAWLVNVKCAYSQWLCLCLYVNYTINRRKQREEEETAASFTHKRIFFRFVPHSPQTHTHTTLYYLRPKYNFVWFYSLICHSPLPFIATNLLLDGVSR